MGKTLSKNELKRITKAACVQAFAIQDCIADEKTAGTMKYTPISLVGSTQRIAAIYGSRGGGASIWVKEEVFALVRSELNPNTTRVEDVNSFNRGFQWAIHFDSPDDPVIQVVAEAAVEHGKERWARAIKRRKDDDRRALTRADREAERKLKKRDPWNDYKKPPSPYPNVGPSNPNWGK